MGLGDYGNYDTEAKPSAPAQRGTKAERFYALAQQLAELVASKNDAYGSSFETCAEALRLLFPQGITPDKYADALAIARMWDKLSRIAHDKKAFGESAYSDLAGYALLGWERDTRDEP